MGELISSYEKNGVEIACVANSMELHAAIRRLLSSALIPLALVPWL